MESYRVTASLTHSPTSFQANPSFISLPPEPHFREPPIASHLRLPEIARPAAASSLDRRIGRCIDDNEISIFDAERYFSEGQQDAVKRTIILNGAAERCGLYRREASFSSSVDGYARHGRTCSFYSTPTVSSEASWNSQSGLLAKRPGSDPVSAGVGALPLKNPTKSPSSAGRRIFGGKCPCAGKKAVDIEEKRPEPKSSIPSGSESNFSVTDQNLNPKAREVGLSSIPERATPEEKKNEFPEEGILKVKIIPGNCPPNPNFFSSSSRLSPERKFPPVIGGRTVNSSGTFGDSGVFTFPILNPPPLDFPEEPPRKSLEVFRSTKEMASPVITPSELQRQALVYPLSGDVTRRSFTFPTIPKPPPDDDASSDASSDLFEIESFSTYTAFHRRDSIDLIREAPLTPSIAPSECYAPSEASVEWSVITAEGFDRASLANFSSSASYCGELRLAQAERDRLAASAGGPGGSRRRCGGFLSCRSEKAVSVVSNTLPLPSPIRSDTVRRPMSRSIRSR